MNSFFFDILMIIVLIFLFAGEPDLYDALAEDRDVYIKKVIPYPHN